MYDIQLRSGHEPQQKRNKGTDGGWIELHNNQPQQTINNINAVYFGWVQPTN